MLTIRYGPTDYMGYALGVVLLVQTRAPVAATLDDEEDQKPPP